MIVSPLPILLAGSMALAAIAATIQPMPFTFRFQDAGKNALDVTLKIQAMPGRGPSVIKAQTNNGAITLDPKQLPKDFVLLAIPTNKKFCPCQRVFSIGDLQKDAVIVTLDPE